MNILLPTDFSENAKNAAAYALKCFAHVPCTFQLLHSLPVSQNKLEYEKVQVPAEFYATFEHFLTFLNAKKVNPHHEFKVVIKADYLIESVREQVRYNNIDLIIMGTKGISNRKTTIVGKNTSEIMTKVKCPLLAISEDAQFQEYKEILFPTDYKIHYNREMLHILLNLISNSMVSVKILEIFNSKTEPSQEQLEGRLWLKNFFKPEIPVFHSLYSPKNGNAKTMFEKNKNVDLIALPAKNLNICQRLLTNHKSHQIPFINQLPLLILH